MTGRATKVDVDDVSKRYATRHGTVRTLDDVSCSGRDGEFCCVVGPSECEKTTLFRITAGLETPSCRDRLRRRPGKLLHIWRETGKSILFVSTSRRSGN